MTSVSQHLEVVDLQEEMLLGRLLPIGPWDKATQLGVHISPLGVIPKKGRASQWQMIMDLWPQRQ